MIKMITIPDNRFHQIIQFVKSVRGDDFEWGSTDCFSLVRRARIDSFDFDPFSSVARWDSKKTALKAFRNANSDASQVMLDSGLNPIDRNFMFVGDIILWKGEDDDGLPRFAIMIAMGQFLTSTPATGVIVVNRSMLLPEFEVWR